MTVKIAEMQLLRVPRRLLNATEKLCAIDAAVRSLVALDSPLVELGGEAGVQSFECTKRVRRAQ